MSAGNDRMVRTDKAKRRLEGHKDRYAYVSGRIRALEMSLLDSGSLNRLYDARNMDDFGRVLTDCGYPAANDPETSLKMELESVFNLLQAIMPEPGFIETLLLFRDIHNLKVILKHLIPIWPASINKNADDRDPGIADLPVFDDPAVVLAGVQALAPYFQQPALVDPAILVRAICDRETGLLPAWLYQAAAGAVRQYHATYDIGAMAAYLDQTAWRQAHRQALDLGNPFFIRYLVLRIDLINLDILLRSRFQHSGESFLEQTLLPDGTIDRAELVHLYRDSHESVRAFYARTPYAALAGQSDTYGQKGSAARFSLLADNQIMALIRQVRYTLSGPEVPLAYLFAREMEIKNIRIILTGLRNGRPSNQTRELTRDSYLAWR